MYDEKDARHILAAFKQIMNESKRVVRMNEAYQDRTTLTNIEKDIEQMMRELEQVFTGSYFLDANKDYHAAQFTP
jgi:hypothetical protein